jgi:hypothetical protein
VHCRNFGQKYRSELGRYTNFYRAISTLCCNPVSLQKNSFFHCPKASSTSRIDTATTRPTISTSFLYLQRWLVA